MYPGISSSRLYIIAGLLAFVGGFLSLDAAADIPQTINHQGVVKVGTTPFTGTGQFRFAIIENGGGLTVWSNDGSQLGAEQMPTNPVWLTVTNGIYNVRLGDTINYGNMTALTPEAFTDDSDGFSLRIWFSDGVHGVQELTPPQPLTSVPFAYRAGDAEMLGGYPASDYAMSDFGYFTNLSVQGGPLSVNNTGDAISAISTGNANVAVHGQNLVGGEGIGVRGLAAGLDATGVLGQATGANGVAVKGTGADTGTGVLGTGGTGVYGQSNPAGGIAVKGDAFSTAAAANYGGWFKAQGTTGVGVYGEASGANGTGVHGKAPSTAIGVNYGGHFEAAGSGGRGVWAQATGVNGAGLAAEASGQNGTGVDIFTSGSNSRGLVAANDHSGNNVELAGPDNAGYFEGDVVTTELYKYDSPKTYVLQITPAEIRPTWGGDDFTNLEWHPNGYIHGDTLGGFFDYFQAPAHLPQGARVTRLRVYYYDNSSGANVYGTVYLTRRQATSVTVANMAYVPFDSTPVGQSTAIQLADDTSIDYAVIDNATYQYYMNIGFGPDDTSAGASIRFYGASIEYTMDTVAP